MKMKIVSINVQGDRKLVKNWDDPSCAKPSECRPRLLGVRNSSQIYLSNFHVRDAVYWTTHLINSTSVTVANLTIRGTYLTI
jgi:polygalacturonase